MFNNNIVFILGFEKLKSKLANKGNALTSLVVFAVLCVSFHAVVEFHQYGLQSGVHFWISSW